jgi:hypothetical protein
MVRHMSVNTPTSYGLEVVGFEARWRTGFSIAVQACPGGAHSDSCIKGTGALSPRVKQPGRGVVDHSLHLAPTLKEG